MRTGAAGQNTRHTGEGAPEALRSLWAVAGNAPHSASSFGIDMSMIVFASMRTLGTAARLTWACLTWACLVWARAAGGGTRKAHDEQTDDSSSIKILPRPCASWIRTI